MIPQTVRGMLWQTGGGTIINTQVLRWRIADTRSVWIDAVAIPLMLLAPALWNGYPLLQWDTGGYLARWYEGYLVPSRSTAFGIYLHFGENSAFWINLGIQALGTFWIVQLTLRVMNLAQPLRLLMISVALAVTTALPWLVSMLLTDIFAGLSVLSLFILVMHGNKTSKIQKCVLFILTAFAAATHSATLGVLLGLCCVGWIARPFLRGRITGQGMIQGSLTIVAGAAMLLSANFAMSGQVAWTPGGYGVVFGRMLQDGIVARYLHEHCPLQKLTLCPYRDQLPATADQFLWGNGVFNALGRFKGLNDEMGFIVLHSLAEYPARQAEAALIDTAQQLVHVGTGEGVNEWIGHTYGIIERYIPTQVEPMRAANQQRWRLDFTTVNYVHVPVALASMLLVAFQFGWSLWRRLLDDLALLAGAITIALFGNAFICGVISGPHDRYGARLAWVATFVALISAAKHLVIPGDTDDLPILRQEPIPNALERQMQNVKSVPNSGLHERTST